MPEDIQTPIPPVPAAPPTPTTTFNPSRYTTKIALFLLVATLLCFFIVLRRVSPITCVDMDISTTSIDCQTAVLNEIAFHPAFWIFFTLPLTSFFVPFGLVLFFVKRKETVFIVFMILAIISSLMATATLLIMPADVMQEAFSIDVNYDEYDYESYNYEDTQLTDYGDYSACTANIEPPVIGQSRAFLVPTSDQYAGYEAIATKDVSAGQTSLNVVTNFLPDPSTADGYHVWMFLFTDMGYTCDIQHVGVMEKNEIGIYTFSATTGEEISNSYYVGITVDKTITSAVDRSTDFILYGRFYPSPISETSESSLSN